MTRFGRSSGLFILDSTANRFDSLRNTTFRAAHCVPGYDADQLHLRRAEDCSQASLMIILFPIFSFLIYEVESLRGSYHKQYSSCVIKHFEQYPRSNLIELFCDDTKFNEKREYKNDPEPENISVNEIDIFEAVTRGDASTVSKYIADGGDICVKDTIGDSPMMLAVENDMGHIIKILVQEGGVDVNERGGEGMETPLILAAYYGYTSLCAFLVEDCNADMEIKSSTGDTALNIACQWGNVETVQYLLDAGANPNSFNFSGKRAGDEFEMVFVDEQESEIIQEALQRAREKQR